MSLPLLVAYIPYTLIQNPIFLLVIIHLHYKNAIHIVRDILFLKNYFSVYY